MFFVLFSLHHSILSCHVWTVSLLIVGDFWQIHFWRIKYCPNYPPFFNSSQMNFEKKKLHFNGWIAWRGIICRLSKVCVWDFTYSLACTTDSWSGKQWWRPQHHSLHKVILILVQVWCSQNNWIASNLGESGSLLEVRPWGDYQSTDHFESFCAIMTSYSFFILHHFVSFYFLVELFAKVWLACLKEWKKMECRKNWVVSINKLIKILDC